MRATETAPHPHALEIDGPLLEAFPKEGAR